MTNKILKVAIYTRVSTEDQNPKTQEELCLEYCRRNPNLEPFAIYEDKISGMKDSRPSFNKLLEDMRVYKFHAIMVWRLDRLGRSLKHLLSLTDEFTLKGVHFISATQNIDTTSPMGQFILHIFGAMAEFERNLISERTKEGLKHAKNRKKIGKRGKDKKPRKKRGGLRNRIKYLNNGGC